VTRPISTYQIGDLVDWICMGCHQEKQISAAAANAGKKWCLACSSVIAVEQRKAWKREQAKKVKAVRGKMTRVDE